METDEDEDVTFEGSHLHKHLAASDYSGPELNFYESGKISFDSQCGATHVIPQTSRKRHVLSLFSKLGFRRDNHEEGFKQCVLQAITSTSLITLEDVDFLSNMFDCTSSEVPLPVSHFNNFGTIITTGVAFCATLLSSSRIPWALRVPVLLCVAGSIVKIANVKLNDWERKKRHEIAKKLESTLHVLHNLCSMMTKSLQFIQEMELIDRGFTLPNLMTHLSMKTLPNQDSALLCLPLRQALVETSQEVHNIMRALTLGIRDSVPLHNAVDHASHYLACTEMASQVMDQQHHVTLPTLRLSLKRCHLQLSEMLRRLALCFLTPTGPCHVQLIEELCRSLPGRITPLTDRLRMAYEYYTAWKVSDSSDMLCPSDVVSSSNDDERPKGLDLALDSLERHLRATALMIDSLRSKRTALLPAMRTQFSHECKAVATCWEWVDMEMHKLSNPPANVIVSATVGQTHVGADPSAQDDGGGGILPLYGAWEQPEVQDLEILEADLRWSDRVGQDATEADDDGVDFRWSKRETGQERVARQREVAAQSKRMYDELQVVLKSKAAEWKEREARVLQRLARTTAAEADVPEPADETQPDDRSSPPPVAPDNHRQTESSLDPAKQLMECAAATEASIRFDCSRIVPSPTLGVQASLAAQVRALASQRGAVHNEHVIGDSDSDDDGPSAPCSPPDA